MPSKGAKRALSAEAGLESKRLKETLKGYGVSKACYDAVAEAVELSELPESVRRMLVTTIPESLCVPKSQRHAFQDQHVKMLENALEQLKLQRQGALETKRLALVEAEALVEDKRLGATRAGEALETQREALLEAKLRLAEVTKEVIRSKADVALKHTALMDFEKEISRSQEEKQLVSEAMHNEFRALRDGSVEGSEAKALYAKLEAIAERIGIETSLMKAVSSSILKLPNLRGSFDAMVVAQLQEGLKKRLNDLDQQLKATEKQQELCDAKALATKSLEEALGQQELKAEVFTEAQKLLESRETQLIEAKKQADLAEPGRVKAVDGLEGAKMDMQNFDEYHWACFEKLRDHEIKVEAVEVAPTAEAGA